VDGSVVFTDGWRFQFKRRGKKVARKVRKNLLMMEAIEREEITVFFSFTEPLSRSTVCPIEE